MKMSIFRVICTMASLTASLCVPAVTVVECLEKDGSTSFRDNCPPEMSVKSTKKLRGTQAPVEETGNLVANPSPVVLFTAPNCEACDLVREQLNGRSVPFTEKDSSQDRDIQAELTAVTGGALTVPTITIGEYKFTGYSRNDLKSALDDAGYP